MARRNAIVETTPQTQTVSVTQADTLASPQSTPVLTMTQDQLDAAIAKAVEAKMASVQVKAQLAELDWFGDYKLFPKGHLTKGYNGEPGKPSENGYCVPFSVKGVHPDCLKNAVKSPSGNLGMAMLYSYMAVDLIQAWDRFGWAPHIIENKAEIVARFLPFMPKK